MNSQLATTESTFSTREFMGEIIQIESVMGDAILTTFAAPKRAVDEARPGHFVQILSREPTAYDPLLRRPYSVYRADRTAQTLTVLVRAYGRGSAWLMRQHVGVSLDVMGPLGSPFTVRPKTQRLLMVAGGVGAAPLRMLAEAAIRDGKQVTYLMGANDAGALLPASELPDEVEYVVATMDGSAGHTGFVTDLIPEYLQWADQVFSCGPEPMFRSLRTVIHQHRMGDRPDVQMAVERAMPCGIGACLGCVVETKRGMRTACVEGPVFEMDEMLWG
ncbi:MAG: dihydroorotate dehydrogenase electron transfer subunit [Chloroflexota bacterium]|nr:dihydroorotate dehydrogenase electron transfer subunit [Chloroflexota bacterium]